MADNLCCAIAQNGTRCRSGAKTQGRCTRHYKMMVTNGPHQTLRNELHYKQLAEKREMEKQYREEYTKAAEERVDNKILDRMHEDHKIKIAALKLKHRNDALKLERDQEDEVARTGVDPDAEAKERKEADRQRQRELAEARFALLQAAAQRDMEERAQRAVLRFGIPPLVLPNPNENLGAFARDPQNIHTTVMVEQTKKIVETVLTIPVPEGYRWNTSECSKTPGEIIGECKLTTRAAWEMIARYCQAETIYDMIPGIYGKVLDSVWQFIKNSEDKEPLCKTIRQEMEDNIGMCAQGNLTRLCNILAGYMDGIGSMESKSEMLGREMAKIAELPHLADKIAQAQKVLRASGLDPKQWIDWLEPMVTDEDREEYGEFEFRVREIAGEFYVTYT